MKRYLVLGLAVIILLLVPACTGNTSRSVEDQLVQRLLKKSESFKAFYTAERDGMPSDISWVIDGTLGPGTEAISDFDTNTIYLRKASPFPNDDFIIAHELCGFALYDHGFPLLQYQSDGSANNDAIEIAAFLSTMLWTPLRDSILRDYGFDVESIYFYYVNPFFDKNNRIQPSTQEEANVRTYFYAQMVIYWEDVLHKKEVSQFEALFSQEYPDLARHGRTIISCVRSHGYTSPAKMRACYQDIIQESNLKSVVQISSMSPKQE